jgi:hypothetical protein
MNQTISWDGKLNSYIHQQDIPYAGHTEQYTPENRHVQSKYAQTRGVYSSLHDTSSSLLATQPRLYRMTGGRDSLLNAIRVHNHSTASCTPAPVSALHGKTLLSLTFPPFSPSNTRLTNPSLMRTTSTQSSRSCLFARTNIGTPLVSSFCSTLSSTSLHSSRRPTSSFCASLESSASVALPTSLLSMTKTIAWQLL